MSSKRRILADVNLWLATLVETHPHHGRAVAWWREEALPTGARVLFCRMTQLGLLRLLCNAKVMGAARRRPAQAWADYAGLLSQEPVGFRGEPRELGPRLHRLTAGAASSSGLWTDAYLAAFADAAGLEVVTFDRGFRRFDVPAVVTIL